MHGYELKKRLGDVLPAGAAISFGSLYPALNRLERTGAVTAASTSLAPPNLPMTGSFDGEAAAFRASRRTVTRGPRNKKVYDITSAGDARLLALIADPADDERTFPVKVALCRFTDRAARVDLLERRRATLVARLVDRSRSLDRADLDRYSRSLLEHERETTERDVAWLDRLLASERALADDAPLPAPSTHRLSQDDSLDTAPTATGGT